MSEAISTRFARLEGEVQSEDFLEERLKLSLHPKKVFITTLASGAAHGSKEEDV